MPEEWTAEEYKHYEATGQKPGHSKPKRKKYGNQPVYIDGIRFDSKREADYYGELKLRQMNGDISFFLMQVPFMLAGVKYIADFVEFIRMDDCGVYHMKVIDTKGVKTKEYQVKKKQMKQIYGIEIQEK